MRKLLLLLVIGLQFSMAAICQEESIDEDWIKANIKTDHPRLILTSESEKVFKKKLKTNASLALAWQLLLKEADGVLSEKPLVFQKRGKRLLWISREALRRMSTLALAYRIEKKKEYLDKLQEEVVAVSAFESWNPSHFLDVAEMSLAVSLALDWCGEWMNADIKAKAIQALREKAFAPALDYDDKHWWIETTNNWNTVCHGGLSAAALTVFEEAPAEATAILQMAVEHIHLGLEPYGPDGVYPEGPSYWFYATDYLTMLVSAFQSALGTDFGFSELAGVRESALYSEITAGPSGEYYNFFDAGLGGYHSLHHMGLLAWFAPQQATGFDWQRVKTLATKQLGKEKKQDRFFALDLLYMAKVPIDYAEASSMPLAWVGQGISPLIVFRDNETDFFLAAKGGRGADNHGNMDAGSFIFELDGVRWGVDPGNQNYNQLEQIMGGELWNSDQDSRRWSLLTKNNFGHSTLTVNDSLHWADARSLVFDPKLDARRPKVSVNLTPQFHGMLDSAKRTFTKVDGRTLQIIDEIIFSERTERLQWQMISQAEVEVFADHAILKQNGKQLRLQVLFLDDYEISVTDLSPPPLDFDKDISNLKRIEIKVNRKKIDDIECEIFVQLSQM